MTTVTKLRAGAGVVATGVVLWTRSIDPQPAGSGALDPEAAPSPLVLEAPPAVDLLDDSHPTHPQAPQDPFHGIPQPVLQQMPPHIR